MSEINEPDAIVEFNCLRLEIKAVFRCDDWANIAQAPIIEQIFRREILDKKSWLSDQIISDKYKKNQALMDRQINSDIGDKYFNLLERINWNSIL